MPCNVELLVDVTGRLIAPTEKSVGSSKGVGDSIIDSCCAGNEGGNRYMK